MIIPEFFYSSFRIRMSIKQWKTFQLKYFLGFLGNIEPMFVDTNEVEKFNPQRPPYPKPTPHFPSPTNVDSNDFPMFSPRPTKPIFIKPRPNRPTFHRPRPNPMSFFHKLFSGLFQG